MNHPSLSRLLPSLPLLALGASLLLPGCSAEVVEALESDDGGTAHSGSSTQAESTVTTTATVTGTGGSTPTSGGSASSGSTATTTSLADAAAPPGPSSPVDLTQPNGEAVWLTVVGDTLYFAPFAAGIQSMPSSGGTPRTIIPVTASGGDYATNDVASDASYLYWAECDGGGTTPSSIYRAPLAGGAAELVASTTGWVGGLVVESGTVYWSAQDLGEIQDAPSAGGAAVTVAGGLKQPAGLGVHDGVVYFTDVDGDLSSVATSGGAVKTLVTGPGLPADTEAADFSQKLVVDDQNVYFSQDFTSPVLAQVSLATGKETVLVPGVAAYGLAVDSTNVYWVESSGDTVSAVPIGGGTVTTLASAQYDTVGPALDANSVYWGSGVTGGDCGLCPPAMGVNGIWKVAK
jgi:hypothetical protein